jgi:hypothetical protein
VISGFFKKVKIKFSNSWTLTDGHWLIKNITTTFIQIFTLTIALLKLGQVVD